MDEQELHNYELGFLARTEEDAAHALALLQQHHVTVLFQGPAQKIKLAYPIKKETFAIFGYIHFSAPSSVLPVLQTDLNNNTHILRFLVITPPLRGMQDTRGEVSSSRRRDSSVRGKQKSAEQPAPVVQKPIREAELTNEALEKKLEEILK